MINHRQEYDIATVRQLLIEAFTAKDLRRFCLDSLHFRDAAHRFGPEYGLDDMVDEVIDYCMTHLRFDELLAEVREARPRQYVRFFPELDELAPPPKGILPVQESLRPSSRLPLRWIVGGLTLVTALIVTFFIVRPLLFESTPTPQPTEIDVLVATATPEPEPTDALTPTRPSSIPTPVTSPSPREMQTVTIAASKTPSKKTITPGQSYNGTIGAGEKHCYYFSTHDNIFVRFITHELDDFNSYSVVYYADGGFIKEGSSRYGEDYLDLAPEPGVEYRICVSARFSGETGSYRITMTTFE